MALEIERKFLVCADAWRTLAEPVRMRQGYVPAEKHVTVRVRTAALRSGHIRLGRDGVNVSLSDFAM